MPATKTKKDVRNISSEYQAKLNKVHQGMFKLGYLIFDSQWSKNPKNHHYSAPVLVMSERDPETPMGLVSVAFPADEGTLVEIYVGSKLLFVPSDWSE